MRKEIRGTAKYFNLEGGFWGIVGDDNNNYQPIQMPEQLKTQGRKLECTIEILQDVFTIAMWGTPCKVISFCTLT
ncbi:MAG: hypothetical protein KJO50_04975 [Bacteroidia bacterium]|nr:hypothetical protein [Bacteroidia bacterium]